MNTKSRSENPSFTFDPIEHKYWLGKKRIPGVSEILQKVGLTKDFKGVDPFYRDRGIATHRAIEFLFKGTLDYATLDDIIKPQFAAFKMYWKKHKDENIIAIEKPHYDEIQYYAGTPDLITNKAIYDWKCSKNHDRTAELQGQAYLLLALTNREHYFPIPLDFIVVELHDDGSYAEFNYGNRFEEWPSVMALYDWKTKGGL